MLAPSSRNGRASGHGLTGIGATRRRHHGDVPLTTDGKAAAPEREHTDESLRTEREKTDQALAEQQEAIQEDADLIVHRARENADAVLTAAREKADTRLDSTASYVAPRS